MSKPYASAVFLLGVVIVLINSVSAEYPLPESPPSPQTPANSYETSPPATPIQDNPSATIQYSGGSYDDTSKPSKGFWAKLTFKTKITIGVILAIILSTLSMLCIGYRYCKAHLHPSKSVTNLAKEDEDLVTVIHIYNEVNVPAEVPQTWWW